MPSVDSRNFWPYLKPESLQRGSALEGPEAEGASGEMELALDPLGTKADPGGTKLNLPFLVTEEEPSLPRLALASSSSGMERRAWDLRRGKDSPNPRQSPPSRTLPPPPLLPHWS